MMGQLLNLGEGRVLKQSRNQSGFTLVEIVIVMSVMALILSVVIPNLRGLQQEGQITKAEAELQTLKTAVVSYWKNNHNAYPSNIHAELMNASPAVISVPLSDPYNTDAENATYGYVTGSDKTFGAYFAIYTKGPRGDTNPPQWVSEDGKFVFSGSGRVVSNAPVERLEQTP